MGRLKQNDLDQTGGDDDVIRDIDDVVYSSTDDSSSSNNSNNSTQKNKKNKKKKKKKIKISKQKALLREKAYSAVISSSSEDDEIINSNNSNSSALPKAIITIDMDDDNELLSPGSSHSSSNNNNNDIVGDLIGGIDINTIESIHNNNTLTHSNTLQSMTSPSGSSSNSSSSSSSSMDIDDFVTSIVNQGTNRRRTGLLHDGYNTSNTSNIGIPTRRASIKLDHSSTSSTAAPATSPGSPVTMASTLQQIEAAKQLAQLDKAATHVSEWEQKLHSLGIKSSGVTISSSSNDVKRITASKDKKNKISPWIKVRTAIRLGLGLQKKEKKKVSYEHKLQARRNERFQKVLRLTEQRKKNRDVTGSSNSSSSDVVMHADFSQSLGGSSSSSSNAMSTSQRANWEEDL